MAHGEVIPATHSAVGEARRGAAAILTLDRRGALNALTPAMIATLDQSYRRLARDPNLYVVILKSADAKAFSAGGDVVGLSTLARSDLEAAKACLRAEYRLNWLHECFSKPSVAFIDGYVMGSGVGISAYATHRVAGPRYRFAMPETAIGFFPDVGTAHLLSRMPHHIGRYLGLTGHAICRADAYTLGLVTHILEPDQMEQVEAGLAEAWPVDPLLDERHADPGVGELARHSELIAHCFAPAHVEQILERLAAVTGLGEMFARKALGDLQLRSPLALKVSLRHISLCAALDLRDTLEVDYRLGCRMLAATDFHEGVRAVLIAKDNAPRWQPSTLAEVTEADLDGLFAAIPGDELALPLRHEMQALRV